MKARTMRRVSQNLRWDIEGLRSMICTPWNLRGKKNIEDSELGNYFIPMSEAEKTKQTKAAEIGEYIPRRIQITKEIFKKYGYTEGCPGCRHIRHPVRKSSVHHSELCRKRIEQEMSKDPEHNAKLRER